MFVKVMADFEGYARGEWITKQVELTLNPKSVAAYWETPDDSGRTEILYDKSGDTIHTLAISVDKFESMMMDWLGDEFFCRRLQEELDEETNKETNKE